MSGHISYVLVMAIGYAGTQCTIEAIQHRFCALPWYVQYTSFQVLHWGWSGQVIILSIWNIMYF